MTRHIEGSVKLNLYLQNGKIISLIVGNKYYKVLIST